MAKPKLSKFIGYAVTAGISMLVGDYVAHHFGHLHVYYDPVSVFFRYNVCYLSIWALNSYMDKKRNSISTEHNENKETITPLESHQSMQTNDSLPTINHHFRGINDSILKSNLKNDSEFIQLNQTLENVVIHYQSIIDNYDIKDIKNDYTEHYLFLKTEVEKLFISIREETEQLLKLEKHPTTQFGQFKEQFVNLMLERANMVQDKLNKINESLFNVKSQNMLLEAKTNHAVLKSKM